MTHDGQTRRPAAASGEVAEWTCPMHPEIRQPGPGSCPICGMALEPVTVTADTGPSPELADMTRRFWVARRAVHPGRHPGDGRGPVPARSTTSSPPRASAWIQLVLATPVVLWAGWPFFERGWTSVRTMKLNMFTLIAMGTGVAWLFSVVATVAPGIFPDAFRMDGAVDVYFEAAAVITTLVLLGQVLELRAREQTSGAIKALLDLTPKTAHRIDRRRHRGRGHPRPGPDRGPAAGPPRREGPGRRDRRGRPLLARRVAGHRRVDAGHQDRPATPSSAAP